MRILHWLLTLLNSLLLCMILMPRVLDSAPPAASIGGTAAVPELPVAVLCLVAMGVAFGRRR